MASITLPVAAVDVGYFSTKFTSGRAEHKQASLIKTGSIPSICPRVAGEAAATAGMSALSGVVVTVNNIPHFVGPDASLRSSGREARAVLDDYSRSDDAPTHHGGKSLLADRMGFVAQSQSAELVASRHE